VTGLAHAAWFGAARFVGLLLLRFSVGDQSEFSDVGALMRVEIDSDHPTAVVDQRSRLLARIGRRSDPLSGLGIFQDLSSES
jgi:hypothetical protein